MRSNNYEVDHLMIIVWSNQGRKQMATTPLRRAIRLFTKSDCGLCEEAKHVLLRVRSKVPFELEEVDIRRKENEEWMLKYCFDIPVVHLNGKEVFRHRVDEAKLEQLLRSPPAE